MKHKRFHISFALFKDMFVEGGVTRTFTVVEHGLPKDAELVGAVIIEPEVIELLLKSESFPEVPQGAEIPIMPATVCKRF